MSKLTIDLDLNTINIQQKLRAISKHAEALADELQEIDKRVCPECENEMDEITAYADNEVAKVMYTCPFCEPQHD